ncbi:MAG TPA: LytTR family DNA-binding domain-containing protein, partial [Caulobacteraceae bacterium]|nr:LytTR family DNA-binding domain-containing protein [Caulobacteraceae bacterium]
TTLGSRSPTSFDIRDGPALLRVPTAEILAVRAAGNYVEFLLDDGRRPLMRASLQQIEAGLAPAGLVRTHRSWIVNHRRVRALVPAGSGDFRLDLGGGVSAPLSRRFPGALEQLRASGR